MNEIVWRSHPITDTILATQTGSRSCCKPSLPYPLMAVSPWPDVTQGIRGGFTVHARMELPWNRVCAPGKDGRGLPPGAAGPDSSRIASLHLLVSAFLNRTSINDICPNARTPEILEAMNASHSGACCGRAAFVEKGSPRKHSFHFQGYSKKTRSQLLNRLIVA